MYYLDTNVLIGIGNLDLDTKAKIIEYLNQNKSDFVVTNTVYEEFNKNIEKFTVPDDIKNKNTDLDELKRLLNLSQNKIESFSNIIDTETVLEFKRQIIQNLNSLANKYDQYAEAKKEENRKLLETYQSLIAELVVDGLSYYDKINLLSVAESRYTHQIPPGYKDLSKNEKRLEHYNDYFIWSEIIQDVQLKKKINKIYLVTEDFKDKGKDDVGKMKNEFSELTKNDIEIIKFNDLLDILNLELIYVFLFNIKFSPKSIEDSMFNNTLDDILNSYLWSAFSSVDESLIPIHYSGHLTVTNWEVRDIDFQFNISDSYTANIEENQITFTPDYDFQVEIDVECYSDYEEEFCGSIKLFGNVVFSNEVELDFSQQYLDESLEDFLKRHSTLILDEQNIDVVFIADVESNVLRII